MLAAVEGQAQPKDVEEKPMKTLRLPAKPVAGQAPPSAGDEAHPQAGRAAQV